MNSRALLGQREGGRGAYFVEVLLVTLTTTYTPPLLVPASFFFVD